MISEAIILAGGLGTRLRSTVPDVPKCMAPVAGHPFLHYVIAYFQNQGINRFVFSLGYKHGLIEDFLGTEFSGSAKQYVCSVEREPLGTGGAVLRSARLVKSDATLVLNGDTLFEVSVEKLSEVFEQKQADCVLSLKPMTNMERYGVVEADDEGKIISFKEKRFYQKGLINGGVYALNVRSFLSENLPERFSFEKDYLEKYFDDRKFYGCVQNGYFIDIGVPEDYSRANEDFEGK